MDGRTTQPQLVQKPLPFVLQLFVGDKNTLCGPYAAKFGSIERVASRSSIGVYKSKVPIDRRAR